MAIDLADVLLLVGAALIVSAVYLLGGWVWLLLAAGVALCFIALRISEKTG